jgi:uncharacterized protein with PQ loop repeat
MLSGISLAVIIGTLTLIIGVVVKIIGFPDQFRINFKRKSTQGVSTLFYVLAFVSYLLWTVHGFFQNDLVLIIGQGVGIITTGMIVIQIIIYRKNKNK